MGTASSGSGCWIQHLSEHGWPLQRGFDRWYGSMSNALSSFQPDELNVDNHMRHADADHIAKDDGLDQLIAPAPTDF